MTSEHAHSRALIRRESALRHLSALEVGKTLTISESEFDVYQDVRRDLPEREFTRRVVDQGHYRQVVLERKA